MSRSVEDIQTLYEQRKKRLGSVHQAALEVRTAYYGDITLPLPELDRNEKPLVANFLYSAGEQKAMRVASTMPDLYYPSSKPGKDTYDKRSRQRRLVNLAWWDLDRMKLKLRKRARHMVYYACSPVMVRPHFEDERPTWQIRNPLSALAPEMDVGEIVPEDIIFTYTQSLAWLQRHYPTRAHEFGLQADVQDGAVTILEYQDREDFVLIATGERISYASSNPYADPIRTPVTLELERVPNKAERCTAIIAGGIGLEHARGGFDGMIGMWQAMGKMMALEAIGMQRAIWKEQWLVDDPNSDGAKVITHADPLHGVMGHVSGGKIDVMGPEPSVFATQIIDRMERYLRIDSGTPAELGGESTSNIRTGKRGDQILSSVLDFPLQEMQEIIAVALVEENKAAIAIDKAYFPTAKSIYLSATAGEIVYEPKDLWERDTHFVRYAHAGVDAQGMVVELGQMVGTGLLSKRSAMESHPLIEDAQGEFDRITQEHVRDGLLQGLAAMAQDPTMAPIVAAVMQRVKNSEVEVEDAVQQVHAEMQQMQAQQAAQQAQAPGMGGPPGAEGQPGMAAPGGAIGPPPQDLTNLTGLLTQLRRGSNAGVGPQAQAVA